MTNQAASRLPNGTVTATAATVLVAAFMVAIGNNPVMADRCYTANGRELRCPPDTPPPPHNPDLTNRELSRPPALLRSQSKLIPYLTLAKEPKKYVGTSLTFSGRVDEVVESGTDVVLTISMWSNENEQWSDAIYVDYRKGSNFGPRIQVNDLVEVHGDFVGIKPYTASLGRMVEIPHIIVRAPGDRDQ
jgi:hypothetical protein